MIIRGIEAVAKSKDIFKSTKKTTLESLFDLPQKYRTPDGVFDTRLEIYQKYERAIEAVAKDNSVKTAYFFQPVPTWSKMLTEEEKPGAARSADPVLYRRIVVGMMTLRQRGLAMYDLGDLLKDEKGTFYADDIHFFRDDKGDSPGYRLMAKRMAIDLAEAWGLKRKD